MEYAPTKPIQFFNAPIKFCVPSLVDEGPFNKISKAHYLPTDTLVPLGKAGSGVAIPQLNPLPGASSV